MPRLTCALKSAKRPLLSKRTPLWVAAALSLGFFGCGTAGHPAGIADDGGVLSKPGPEGNDCRSPAEGCACTTPGATVDCGRVQRSSGDYVPCAMGVRTCTDGSWSTCIGDRVATVHVTPGNRQVQGLGTTMTCSDNPCDPYCRIILDDPNGLALPDGGPLGADGGLQLLPPPLGAGNGACTSMVVTPTPQTLTVTNLGGSGLRSGEYFNQIDLNASQISTAWAPTATRVDPVIHFNWYMTGPQVPGIGSNVLFGSLERAHIGCASNDAYTICAETDDGVRLWLDDVPQLDSCIIDHRPKTVPAPLSWTLAHSTSCAWNTSRTSSARLQFCAGLLLISSNKPSRAQRSSPPRHSRARPSSRWS